MKFTQLAIASLLLCCLPVFAENELMPSITDTFNTDDSDINDTTGNTNWLSSYCQPGWSISGGVLKKDAKGANELITSNYVRSPDKGKVVVQCEVIGQVTGPEHPELRLGIVGKPGLNNKSIQEFPGVYWRDFGGHGRLCSRKEKAEEDMEGNSVNYRKGQESEKIYYRLEVTSSAARIFCSIFSMPDGTEEPVATLDLTNQDWSLWQTGAYGYLRVVGTASIDNFELSNADAKLP